MKISSQFSASCRIERTEIMDKTINFFFLFFLYISLGDSSEVDYNFDKLCTGYLYQALEHPFDRHQFIGCHHEKATVSKCMGENEIFDPINIACIDALELSEMIESDSSSCEDSEDSSEMCKLHKTTKSTTTQATSTSPSIDICEGIPTGNIPNPYDCTAYYYCDSEISNPRECEDETIFNPESSTCEPGDPETCNIFTTTTSDSSTTTSESNPCDGIVLGYVPDPYNCTAYFLCILSIPYHSSCPPGHVFDSELSSCILGDPETCEIFSTTEISTDTTITSNTNTESTETTTTETFTSTISTTTSFREEVTTPTSTISITTTQSVTSTTSNGGVDVSFVCPQDIESNGVLIPHPDYCERYYECLYGVAYLRFCSDDLHFDVITRSCVDPSLAFCGNLIKCQIY